MLMVRRAALRGVQPANWYRTIDRIYPALAATPKLLNPHIEVERHIVYEPRRLYPHHNLHYRSRHDDVRRLRDSTSPVPGQADSRTLPVESPNWHHDL
jgi:hypothetical protein